MKVGSISSALKLILFSVSVLITCVVVFVGITASQEAKKISSGVIDQMTELNNDISDSGIMMFDGTEVYGSEVINFMKKTLGDCAANETSPVYLYVKTSTSENTYINSTYVKNVRQFTDVQHYIKPTAKFVGQVMKNTNDVIVGVRFIQK